MGGTHHVLANGDGFSESGSEFTRGRLLRASSGTHKFVYDVWGDTVNTASRMESYSLPGRIQISAATRNALDGRFTFEPRGALDIKGKGMMETYFLVDGPAL